VIERRAVGDDADGGAERVVEICAFDRDHGVAARQRNAREIAEEVGQAGELRAGLVDRTTVVESLQPVQAVEIGLEGIGELVDQPGPCTRVHAAPRLAFERGARARHGAVDIFRRGIGNAGDHIAGCGIADVQHRAASGLDFTPVDEIAVDFDVDRRGF
jgi:hypothetical protein